MDVCRRCRPYLDPPRRWRRHLQQEVPDIPLQRDLEGGQRYPVEVEEPLPEGAEVRPRRQQAEALGRVHLLLRVERISLRQDGVTKAGGYGCVAAGCFRSWPLSTR